MLNEIEDYRQDLDEELSAKLKSIQEEYQRLDKEYNKAYDEIISNGEIRLAEYKEKLNLLEKSKRKLTIKHNEELKEMTSIKEALSNEYKEQLGKNRNTRYSLYSDFNKSMAMTKRGKMNIVYVYEEMLKVIQDNQRFLQDNYDRILRDIQDIMDSAQDVKNLAMRRQKGIDTEDKQQQCDRLNEQASLAIDNTFYYVQQSDSRELESSVMESRSISMNSIKDGELQFISESGISCNYDGGQSLKGVVAEDWKLLQSVTSSNGTIQTTAYYSLRINDFNEMGCLDRNSKRSSTHYDAESGSLTDCANMQEETHRQEQSYVIANAMQRDIDQALLRHYGKASVLLSDRTNLSIDLRAVNTRDYSNEFWDSIAVAIGVEDSFVEPVLLSQLLYIFSISTRSTLSVSYISSNATDSPTKYRHVQNHILNYRTEYQQQITSGTASQSTNTVMVLSKYFVKIIGSWADIQHSVPSNLMFSTVLDNICEYPFRVGFSSIIIAPISDNLGLGSHEHSDSNHRFSITSAQYIQEICVTVDTSASSGNMYPQTNTTEQEAVLCLLCRKRLISSDQSAIINRVIHLKAFPTNINHALEFVNLLSDSHDDMVTLFRNHNKQALSCELVDGIELRKYRMRSIVSNNIVSRNAVSDSHYKISKFNLSAEILALDVSSTGRKSSSDTESWIAMDSNDYASEICQEILSTSGNSCYRKHEISSSPGFRRFKWKNRNDLNSIYRRKADSGWTYNGTGVEVSSQTSDDDAFSSYTYNINMIASSGKTISLQNRQVELNLDSNCKNSPNPNIPAKENAILLRKNQVRAVGFISYITQDFNRANHYEFERDTAMQSPGTHGSGMTIPIIRIKMIPNETRCTDCKSLSQDQFINQNQMAARQESQTGTISGKRSASLELSYDSVTGYCIKKCDKNMISLPEQIPHYVNTSEEWIMDSNKKYSYSKIDYEQNGANNYNTDNIHLLNIPIDHHEQSKSGHTEQNIGSVGIPSVLKRDTSCSHISSSESSYLFCPDTEIELRYQKTADEEAVGKSINSIDKEGTVGTKIILYGAIIILIPGIIFVLYTLW